MDLKCLACWLVACLAAHGAPLAAQIAVSPSRFELTLGESPATETIRVFNHGKRQASMEVTVVHWDLDEENQVRVIPPHEQSLDQWVVVNPLRFDIPPGRSQAVRFSIRPRLKPTAGEHRAMIFFNQLPDSESHSGVRFLFRVGVAIYGHVGPVSRVADLGNTEFLGQQVALEVHSRGSAHARFRGQYAIWSGDGFPGKDGTDLIPELDEDPPLPEHMLRAGPLPSTPVLPDTRRRILLQLGDPLPAGDYVLDLNGHLGDRILDQAISFTVPEPEAADAGGDP